MDEVEILPSSHNHYLEIAMKKLEIRNTNPKLFAEHYNIL